MRVPIVNLGAQHRALRKELDEAIGRIIENGQFIMGPEVEALEEDLRKYLGVEWAFGCASGTAALELALMAYSVGPGDEVITTPFTFISTAEVICLRGAHPVFVDIEHDSFNIDSARVGEAVTPKTRALIPVHLYGQAADMDPLMDLAKKKDLVVIEDAAQVLGADYRGKKLGTIGHVGCFSFFPTKNLGCMGDGGLLAVRDVSLSQKISMMRVHGSSKKYQHALIGTNSRLDAIQAAVLRVKLAHLDGWNAKRAKIAALYHEGLHDLPLELPKNMGYGRHIYHQYSVRFIGRDALRDHLSAKGIQSAVHYPIPLHLQPAFAYLGLREGTFPESERAAREVLCLPIYPEMGDDAIAYVIDGIRSYFK
jgi:dTDP-4-amino-4,6-dideoxygalactose transaminase